MNPETFNVMLKFFEKVLENKEEYECKFCLEPFIGIEKLKIHSITKHLENRFVCDFCLKELKSESNLVKHIDMMHMKLIDDDDDDTHDLEVEPNKVKMKKRDNDYRLESESETEDSDYDRHDDVGRRMKKPPRKYPRKCDHCDYEVPVGKVHYHHYMIMHKDILDQYPYGAGDKMPCSYCGILKSPSHLKTHEAKHSGLKVKCTLCEKQFDSDRLMKRHRKRVHTAPKFLCDYCTKGYKTKTDFLRHIRIHTGEKPYKCHICDAAFAHSGNRQIHIRTAHQNIKQAPKNKQVINKQKNKSSKTEKSKSSKKKEDMNQKGRPKKVATGSELDSDDEALITKKNKKSQKKENKKQKDRPKEVQTDSNSESDGEALITKMFLSNRSVDCSE